MCRFVTIVPGIVLQSSSFSQLHMWDMSALIRRCENFGLFYNFCSRLVEALEYQDKSILVGRHVNFSNVTVPSVSYEC